MPTSASSFSRRPADLGADDAAAGGNGLAPPWGKPDKKARNCGV